MFSTGVFGYYLLYFSLTALLFIVYRKKIKSIFSYSIKPYMIAVLLGGLAPVITKGIGVGFGIGLLSVAALALAIIWVSSSEINEVEMDGEMIRGEEIAVTEEQEIFMAENELIMEAEKERIDVPIIREEPERKSDSSTQEAIDILLHSLLTQQEENVKQDAEEKVAFSEEEGKMETIEPQEEQPILLYEEEKEESKEPYPLQESVSKDEVSEEDDVLVYEFKMEDEIPLLPSKEELKTREDEIEEIYFSRLEEVFQEETEGWRNDKQ
jgi:uncharacterized membrane protein YhiD involved in acid resistance